MKFIFMPFSIIAGILAALIGKKMFDVAWGLIDDEEPPVAKHRDVDMTKLVLSLVLEGALFRAVRGLVDHESRRAFERATGRWPGEIEPDAK
jgi:Protein of unknown function (DUF4235)